MRSLPYKLLYKIKQVFLAQISIHMESLLMNYYKFVIKQVFTHLSNAANVLKSICDEIRTPVRPTYTTSNIKPLTY